MGRRFWVILISLAACDRMSNKVCESNSVAQYKNQAGQTMSRQVGHGEAGNAHDAQTRAQENNSLTPRDIQASQAEYSKKQRQQEFFKAMQEAKDQVEKQYADSPPPADTGKGQVVKDKYNEAVKQKEAAFYQMLALYLKQPEARKAYLDDETNLYEFDLTVPDPHANLDFAYDMMKPSVKAALMSCQNTCTAQTPIDSCTFEGKLRVDAATVQTAQADTPTPTPTPNPPNAPNAPGQPNVAAGNGADAGNGATVPAQQQNNGAPGANPGGHDAAGNQAAVVQTASGPKRVKPGTLYWNKQNPGPNGETAPVYLEDDSQAPAPVRQLTGQTQTPPVAGSTTPPVTPTPPPNVQPPGQNASGNTQTVAVNPPAPNAPNTTPNAPAPQPPAAPNVAPAPSDLTQLKAAYAKACGNLKGMKSVYDRAQAAEDEQKNGKTKKLKELETAIRKKYPEFKDAVDPGAFEMPMSVATEAPSCRYKDFGELVHDQSLGMLFTAPFNAVDQLMNPLPQGGHASIEQRLLSWLLEVATAAQIKNNKVVYDGRAIAKHFAAAPSLRAYTTRIGKIVLERGQRPHEVLMTIHRRDGVKISMDVDRDWERSCNLLDHAFDANAQPLMVVKKGAAFGRRPQPFAGGSCNQERMKGYSFINLSSTKDKNLRTPEITLLVGTSGPLKGVHSFYRTEPNGRNSPLSANLQMLFLR